jgi:hypothetical protein
VAVEKPAGHDGTLAVALEGLLEIEFLGETVAKYCAFEDAQQDLLLLSG